MTTEQPYFVVRVTRCGECPHAKHARCVLVPFQPTGCFMENVDGITPTCPMWPQRVQEKKE